MFVTIIIYSPFHELGHLITAHLTGIQIISLDFYKITVNLATIMNPTQMYLFKASGYFYTFYPALLLFLYLWKRNSKYWIFPYFWMVITPLASGRDFQDMGQMLNITFSNSLNLIPQIASILLLLAFIIEIATNKENCYFLLP